MSPNLENQMPDNPYIESNDENIHLTLTPISDLSISTTLSSDTTPSSEGNNSDCESNSEITDHPHNITFVNYQRNYLPLEHNIRELLVRVSNTENLDTVTQIKLRVITNDMALQQLNIYLPALRELTLDGSVVFSLRDLGNGLKNLKNLRVNQCQLSCIDGVLGFEDLEELYAADNDVKDLSPCAFLSNLKILDVRRNAIKHFGSLSFLNLCDDLKHLLLQGNAAADELSGYRQMVKRILPNLEILDDLLLEHDDSYAHSIDDIVIDDLDENYLENTSTRENVTFTPRRAPSLSRPNPRSSEASSGFTVRFPPKVCNGNREESP